MPSQTTGPDIEPQTPVIPQMQLQPLENVNTEGVGELAGMGSKRAMGLMFKKKKEAPGLMNNDFLRSFLLS